jgi:hypothetical protein
MSFVIILFHVYVINITKYNTYVQLHSNVHSSVQKYLSDKSHLRSKTIGMQTFNIYIYIYISLTDVLNIKEATILYFVK